MIRIDKKELRNYLILIVLGACCFLPFLGSVHLFDWDEINFAEASREMIASGNFMQVTINYQPFWEKPPLFFWLQVLSMKVWGVNEFAARFVNAFFGILTLLVVYTVGRRVYDSRFGFLWAVAFIGSFLPHFFFKSGIIDPVFNLFIFLAITFIASGFLSQDKKKKLLVYTAAGIMSGLAVLSKGPVAFMMIALTVGIYWATVRFRKTFTAGEALLYLGSMCFTASVFYGIETLVHGTWFIEEFIRYQIRLFSTGDAGHGRPFYFHFLVILFGCFPASFFAIRSFMKRHEPQVHQQVYNRFMIILFWVVLITFSIVKTKTVLYSSLTWFPVTYLAAVTMYGVLKGAISWGKWLNRFLIIFSGITAAAIAFFPVLIINKDLITPLIKDKFAVACLQKPVYWSGFEFLVGTIFFAVLIYAFLLISRKRFYSGFAVLLASCAICCEAFMIVFTPKIEEYTQGGPVEFYKENSSGDVYVRSLFKSYADLYYGNKRPGEHPQSHDKQWLLTGKIDKPVLFVGKITQDKKYGAPEMGLTKLKSEYGFVYYRRDPPSE
ncbi:MAG: glycosyltransferase family 39 protein [Fibrobacter sp.]|nr:glycosyltransferase family 39 protein [Fibrobacter sp.]